MSPGRSLQVRTFASTSTIAGARRSPPTRCNVTLSVTSASIGRLEAQRAPPLLMSMVINLRSGGACSPGTTLTSRTARNRWCRRFSSSDMTSPVESVLGDRVIFLGVGLDDPGEQRLGDLRQPHLVNRGLAAPLDPQSENAADLPVIVLHQGGFRGVLGKGDAVHRDQGIVHLDSRLFRRAAADDRADSQGAVLIL